MTSKSETLLQGVLKIIAETDPTFTEQNAESIIRIINGNCDEYRPDFLISRSMVSKIIGKDEKTVDYYCQKGDFKRKKIGKSKKACGISALSVADATGISINSILSAKKEFERSN